MSSRASHPRSSGQTVAALYVERDGVYWNLPDVDPWDEERDARNYLGPHPVVAHPPCNRWARLSRRENRFRDHGCFKAALADVRRWGGVLEHPAYSYAWHKFSLPRPLRGHGWSKALDDPGWVCEVDQHAYGFPTRKLTWLYYVGNAPPAVSPVISTGRGCDYLWSTERNHTPEAFRDLLLATARSVYSERDVAA